MRREIKEPNFFIVGAAKSGTSSLAYYLGQHPDIYMSPVKEPCYFLSDVGWDDYNEYISLFKGAGDALAVGEASTGYLFDEHTAGNIHERFPDAKIIIILRNPTDMAFSLWRYVQKYGLDSKTFEEAISDEEREYRKSEQSKKSCSVWWGQYLYLDRALYFNQVKRYLDVFGRDHVKVYIFERFIREPEKICQDTFAFLGVNNSFIPNCKKVVNEGGELHSHFINKLINRKYPLLRRLLPAKFRVDTREFLKALNLRSGKRVTMEAKTREALKECFRDDIMNLESLLDDNIHEWKPKYI